jgi:hypothetical protein
VSAGFVDDLAGSVRRSLNDVAKSGLTTFGPAAMGAAVSLGALADPAFVTGAASGADTLASRLVTAFGTDLAGRVAHDIDTNGLPGLDGDVRFDTQLVAFASGQAASPVADVVVSHPFAFALPPVGGVDVAATLTLTATCAFAAGAAPKISTSAKIEVTLDWSSAADAKS